MSADDVDPPYGTVTSLVAAGHGGDRVDVYIDGRWALRLSQSQLVVAGLYAGLTLTTSQWSALIDTTVEEKAYSQALNFLSYRPRSAREVRENLSSHGVEAGVVTRIVERLEKLVSREALHQVAESGGKFLFTNARYH